MANPTVFVSALTFTLTQRIVSVTTYTSITAATIDDWSSVTQGGICKLNKGSASEWFSFTGITIGSTTGGITTITFTGITMGLDKNATAITSTTSTNRKNHASGTTVGKLVYHSQQLNQVFQKDKDNTISGTNTFTGTNTFSSTTKNTLVVQRVTTTEKNALPLTEGAFLKDDTTGQANMVIGGAWQAFGVSTAPVNASETVAGIVEKSTDSEFITATETGSTGAFLFCTPRQLGGTGTAGEVLARNDFVYIKASDGKLYKATQNVASVAQSWNVVGVVVVGGSANDTVYIQRLDGEYTYSSAHGFTLGATLYLSTEGALTETKPVLNSETIVPMIIATATSTTKVAFMKQRIPRRVAFKNTENSGTSFVVTTTGAAQTITCGFDIDRVEIQHFGYMDNMTYPSTGFGKYIPSESLQVCSYYTFSGGAFAAGYFGNVNFIMFMAEYAGTATSCSATATVDGSNNVVITWTNTSSTTALVNYNGVVYERL